MNKIDDRPDWVKDLGKDKPSDLEPDPVQVTQEFNEDISKRLSKSDMWWWIRILVMVILSSFIIGVFVGPAVNRVINPPPKKICRVIHSWDFTHADGKSGTRHSYEECHVEVEDINKEFD